MRDAATMVRRNMRHTVRNPGAVIMTIAVPVVLLLLFVGVFGDALTAGFGAAVPGDGYVDYVVAGIVLMTLGYGSSVTALAVNRDMTEGIIVRFRSMAISRTAVLTGHVVASTARTMAGALLVVAVAVPLGLRPADSPVRLLAAAGMLLLMTVALTWLGVAVGLAAKTPDGVAPLTLALQVLPFLSSAFVPPEVMSGPVRWFAANEPFTPVTDTLRGLMLGTPVDRGLLAVGWCLVLTVTGYLWARALFNRDPA